MYHAKKFSTASLVPHKGQSSEQPENSGGLSSSAAKNSTPAGGSGKQRLRWTSDLHDRFVDAITQLGGPDSGYFLLSNIYSIVVVLLFCLNLKLVNLYRSFFSPCLLRNI